MPLDPTLPFASGGSGKQLEPAYETAFNAYRATPTPQTRSALLVAVDPVINTAIRSYGGQSAGSPTLRGRAKQLALRAFDSYEPSRGTLQTHLLSQLRSLQRAGAQQANIIQMPERVRLQLQQLHDAEAELTAQLGQEPSDMQLADHMGLSLKRINYIRQARPATATGTLMHGDADTQHEMPASTIPGSNPAAGWEELIYYDMSDTDRLVFDHLLGRHGRPRLTPGALAKKLGLSVSAVSQRAARLQSMLDERYNTELF